MITDIQETYEITYRCDMCKRAERMITVRTLGEFRRAVGTYGNYVCHRCDGEKKRREAENE